MRNANGELGVVNRIVSRHGDRADRVDRSDLFLGENSSIIFSKDDQKCSLEISKPFKTSSPPTLLILARGSNFL